MAATVAASAAQALAGDGGVGGDDAVEADGDGEVGHRQHVLVAEVGRDLDQQRHPVVGTAPGRRGAYGGQQRLEDLDGLQVAQARGVGRADVDDEVVGVRREQAGGLLVVGDRVLGSGTTLVLPMLIPRTGRPAVGPRAGGPAGSATASAPSLLKPIRLTTARSAGSRNSRGRRVAGLRLAGDGADLDVPEAERPEGVDADAVLVEARGEAERRAGTADPSPSTGRPATPGTRRVTGAAARIARNAAWCARSGIGPGQHVVEEQAVGTTHQRSGPPPLPVLQAADADLAGRHRLDALHRGAEPLDGGDARDVGEHGRRTDLVAVEAGRAAGGVGRVDDQVDVAVADELDGGLLALRALALVVLADHGDAHAVAAQHLGGALGGQDLEAPVGQHLDREDHVALVAVGDRHEDPPGRGQRAVRRGLGLGEGGAEVGVEAHHLAGRLHLRARGRCRRCGRRWS